MPSIRSFIDLNKDAQWLALKLLGQIPQDVLWPNDYDAPDLSISINGYEIENIDNLLTEIMLTFRQQVNETAREIVLEHFDVTDRAYHDAFRDARRMLDAHLREIYHIEHQEEQ